MKEVRYDKEARTVMSDAGFAYLVYYSNDQAAKMLRCVCAFPREQVKVDVGSARVLAVTCEGNFFSFVVD
ncbi:unnamed protein product [Gongylonema pulchrum]|uniref:DUF2835 family protein n=1 Tax=Gongylonema pulchrum TaxID=637853 RepID=A0A183DK61_9BILA|nr:unnamed protein product [Gongylonema pulchrum]